ncbi:hypothetical protein WKW77_20075 [Variovorax ureilyticus]|uniref:Uncharacterized protein n=1 Tax=Variovorax ureilyticus TaxID=1836198 RepID=A0ABU8VIG3_9BURK
MFRAVRQIVIPMLAMIGLAAFAEPIPLICRSPSGDHEMSVVIDPARQTVLMDGWAVENVHFSDQNIYFSFTTKSGQTWSHNIKRATGTMSIMGSDKSSPPPYLCQRAAPNKF